MIFIPTYNCEKQLPRVFNKINDTIQNNVEEIVVIDNRSTDRTLQTALDCAKQIHIKTTIFQNHHNYSLGGSIKRAFLYAIEQHYDYVIVLHGDDQADIRDFTSLLETRSYANKDIVIGARFHPNSNLSGYSLIRTLGNKTLNTVCGLVTGRKVYDLIAGINCFKVEFLKDKFFLKFPDNLTFDAHVLLYALHHQANIEYVPITWREEDQISNAKVVRQAFIILKLFGRYLLQKEKVFSVDQSSHRQYTSEIITPTPLDVLSP